MGGGGSKTGKLEGGPTNLVILLKESWKIAYPSRSFENQLLEHVVLYKRQKMRGFSRLFLAFLCSLVLGRYHLD